MAELTPKKTLTSHVCRCCNCGIQNNPIDLFGIKSETEQLIASLENVTGLNFVENDGFSRKICKSCYNCVKQFAEFKKLCAKSRADQAKLIRFKRGKKELESPSLSEERQQKRGKHHDNNRSRVRQCLQLQPAITQPKECREQLPKTAARILPEFLQPKAAIEPSKGVLILAKSGLRNSELSCRRDLLSPEDCKPVIVSMQSADPHQIAEAVMKIPLLRNAVKNVFLKGVDSQCEKLCVRTTGQPSVLREPCKNPKSLVEFKWETILTEMKERAPDVLDFLVAMAVPKLKGNDGRQIMPLCTAYGILMNVQCRELSLVQKVNAVLLGVGNATRRTFDRMNKSCITQSRESYRRIMDGLGSDLTSVIKAKIESGLEMRVVFDNFDFRILANILLRNHRNSDIHWIAQYVTFDRVSSGHLDDSKPIVPDINDFANVNYLLNKEELQQQRSEFIILVARVLLLFFPALQPLTDAVPEHISHRHSKEMAQKSDIIGLPVVPFNQNKVADVCQYLQWLQDFFLEVFKTENEPPLPDDSQENVLEKVRVPLVGDLLGRERVTGAKKTRLGCDSPVERFENIIESPALWHTKQSFLSYVWEQLYSSSAASGRDEGTLYHLRQHFRLVNVPNNVKKNYKSAENLMLSATKEYLCTAFKTWAGLDKLDGVPENLPKLPKHTDTIEVKKEFIEKQFGKFVDEYVLVEFDIEKTWRESLEERRRQQQGDQQQGGQPQGGQQQPEGQAQTQRDTPERNTNANNHLPTPGVQSSGANSSRSSQCREITVGQVVILVQRQLETQGSYDVLGVGKVVQSTADSHSHVPVLVAFAEQKATGILSVGQVVLWPRALVAVYGENTSKEPPPVELPSPISSIPTTTSEDRRMNYGLQILQLGVFLMQLNDTEAEGDGQRSLRNWKLLMLYFRSRPRGMKYAFEAMRLITFVKALYSERMAHRVLQGQFVNPKGGLGKNYANDLKMEHEVKNDKGVLKGLCGNKTLQAVQTCTSAGYLLNEAAKQYDRECNIPPESTSHTYACSDDDIREMIELISTQEPFQHQPGRKLHSFPSISKSPLDQLNVSSLHSWLTKNKVRLANNPYSCDDTNDVGDDDGEGSSDDESDKEEEVEAILLEGEL